jgi:hypothetical protein
MKCPKCGSTNTYKPSVQDPKWRLGDQRCGDCGYQDDWMFFTSLPNKGAITQAANAILRDIGLKK